MNEKQKKVIGSDPDRADDGSCLRARVAVLAPGGVGGEFSGKYIPALTGLLDGLGKTYDLTVYSLTNVGPLDEALQQRNYRIRAVRGGPEQSLYWRVIRLLGSFIKDSFRQRYDLIHGVWAVPCGMLAVLLGKLYRVPSVVGLHGGEMANLPELEYGGARPGRLRRMTLWTCRQADQLVCLTRFQKKDLRKNGIVRETVVIPLGADRRLFRPGRLIRSPQAPIRFLHVGNLTGVKDQKTLLRAFNLIRADRGGVLRIVGPDYFQGQIQEFCKSLNLQDHVRFTGFVAHRDLPEHYRWANCLLHTSVYEGQGLVVAEAAASGVLTAGTRVGLLADFGEAMAITASVGDHRGLAQAVLAVLDDPDRATAIRERARLWAETHDLEWSVAAFSRLYQKTIEDHTRPGSTPN